MKQPRKKTKGGASGAGLYFMVDPPTPRPRDSGDDKLNDKPISKQKQIIGGGRRWASKHSSHKDASPPTIASAKLKTRFGLRPGYEDQASAFHAGLDFEAPPETPVFAVRSGTVMFVAHDEWCVDGFIGYGNVVVLYHPEDDLWSSYGHLETIHVMPGAIVEAGQVIGRIGNTTNGRLMSMSFRLHFEIRVRGRDGLPPFPGPHLVNSRDPEYWLQSLGVCYDDEGNLVSRTRHVA